MELYDINAFNATLSRKPYCADNLGLGLKIRNKAQAIKHKYIQANDNYIKFLVIDCDHNDFYVYEDANLAPPNFITKNPQNGHFHAIWALANPIYKDYVNKAKNLAYFAKIQQAYTEKCRGDRAYINLITKNPNHQHWQTVWINRFYAYSLDELADYVELPEKITKKEVVGEGRNCYLFDTAREFAYKEVLFYKENQASYDDFYNVVFRKLEKLNVFEHTAGLNFNELKAIAKSISKFCWANFTSEKFSNLQKIRSHKRKSVKNAEKARQEFYNEFFKQ